MRTIVLDTNCLLAILPSGSRYHSVWNDLRSGSICLCVSTEIMNEYEEILEQKVSAEFAAVVMKQILGFPCLKRVAPTYFLQLIEADPDDNKFVDCAFCGEAELIVTNDTHFNILTTIPFPKLVVIKLQDFMKLIS